MKELKIFILEEGENPVDIKIPTTYGDKPIIITEQHLKRLFELCRPPAIEQFGKHLVREIKSRVDGTDR
jgi:hypothetical protein